MPRDLEATHDAGRCGPCCPFCIMDEVSDEEWAIYEARVALERDSEIACDTGD